MRRAVLLGRLLGPAAAEGLLELDEAREERALGADELLPRLEERALRVEDVQIIRQALLVLLRHERHGALGLGDVPRLLLADARLGRDPDDGVRDLPEGDEDRLVVIRRRRVRVRVRLEEARVRLPALEDRDPDR